MKGKPVYFLLLFLTHIACEDVVRFPDQDDYPALPVIEAILTDSEEVQKVRVTYSTNLNDSLAYSAVSDADVIICSSEGETFSFSYDGNGWYNSSVFAACPGVEYTLEVTLAGITYVSTGSIQERGSLDSVYYKYDKPPESKDSAYYVYFDLKKHPANLTGYYLVDVDTNGSRITHGSELYIFQDNYVDQLKGLSINIPLQVNDTMDIRLYTLSKELFDYYFKLSYQVFSLDLSHISYQTNLPALFEPWTPGYFQVSAVIRKEVVIVAIP